jgi:FtsZ-binding cell division protein ZapB
MDNTEQKPLTLTFEDYIKLIGAGPYNEPAFTIFRTLEAHQYKIVHASQQTEALQAEVEELKSACIGFLTTPNENEYKFTIKTLQVEVERMKQELESGCLCKQDGKALHPK